MSNLTSNNYFQETGTSTQIYHYLQICHNPKAKIIRQLKRHRILHHTQIQFDLFFFCLY